MVHATPQGWRVLLLGLAGAVTVSVVLAGCQTTAGSSLNQTNPRGLAGPTTGTDSSAGSVELARKSIEAGETTTAIPRLLHVISNAPQSKASLDARYWLAIAYSKIESYRDAIDMMNEYLRLSPEGRYAADAQREIEALDREYRAKFQTAEEMSEEVRELAERVRQNPNDHEMQIRLANVLWKRGDYESAAKIYYDVIGQHPAYAEDAELRDRIERLPQGGFVVLTPAEIQRRAAEKQPLAVFNTASFKSGKDLLTREPLYYAVTGQVVNQSSSVMYGVSVNVTIYGFGNMVYDTNTIHIGRMNPGEIRAFSTRFSNFDNIDEVQRFECVARANG
jgi:tetratricopeptide (TPR) repeat protein